MGLKPHTARWFELLTPSESLPSAIEALARTGAVQIEARVSAPSLDAMHDLGGRLGDYERLLQRFGPYLPKDGLRRSPTGTVEELIDGSLGRLRTWSVDAEALIGTIERLEHEQSELLLLREFVSSGGSLANLAETGPMLRVRLCALGANAPSIDLPDAVLRHRIDGPEHVFLVVAGLPHFVTEAESQLLALDARVMRVPSDPDVDGQLLAVTTRLAEKRAELETSWERHDVRRAVADMKRLCWLSRSVPRLPHTANFCIVTGWSDDETGVQLRDALEREAVPALLRILPPPEGLDPPVILDNPAWARPFEQFAALLGTPSRHESDPSVALAIVVPMIFGYMFGDVGHGLTLVVLGFALRRRYPFLAVLIPAGISATAFGFVFGCVFTLEGIVEPLWTHPLSNPIAILAGSLGLGALVLSLGIALSALGTLWRGRPPADELALFLVYGGSLGLLLDGRAFAAIALGFGLAGVVHAIEAHERRARAALVGFGQLVEHALELGVGTLSFARVGAFALAHAGLSAAVLALSVATTNVVARIAILVFGNVLVIAIEGLVVSIQTTRLVLFEFFARFLRGEGRVFRPLAPPNESSPITGVIR